MPSTKQSSKRPAARKSAARKSDPFEGRKPEDVPGLTGASLDTYLRTGKRLRQQMADALLEADRLAAMQSAAQSDIVTTKESNMPATAKPASKRTRTRKGQQDAPKQSRAAKRAEQPASDVITAAEVARTNELDGTRFRKFLRAEGIERQFATKADARKAVSAYRKAVKAGTAK